MSLKAAALHFGVPQDRIDEHCTRCNVERIKDLGACADLNAANNVITNNTVAVHYQYLFQRGGKQELDLLLCPS